MSISTRDDTGNRDNNGPGNSVDSHKVIISTTIVGGFCLIALLIYALYRRSRHKNNGGCELPVFHNRKPTSLSDSAEVQMSPESAHSMLKAPVPTYAPTGHPQHAPFRTMSPNSLAPTTATATTHRFTKRLEAAQLSISDFWGSNGSNRYDVLKSGQKSSAPSSYQIATPALTAATTRGVDEYATRNTGRSPPRTRPASLDRVPYHDRHTSQLKVNTTPSPPSPTSMMPVSACSTRDSLVNRWSWTNSQAPPTPRINQEVWFAPSTRSSLSSLPRLKSIADWVRTQSTRTKEVAPPLPFAHHNTINLKNQAYKPTLIPTPARALTKPRLIRVGSINALSRPSTSSRSDRHIKPLPASPVPVTPEAEQQQAKWNQKYLDLVERDRTNKYRMI